MDVIISKISIDLVCPGKNIPVVYAVQGEENTRSVELSLCCEGKAWNIPGNTIIAVRYRKPDQTGGYYDKLPDGSAAYSYTGNVITIKLAPQMLSVAGSVLAQVELLENDQILSTFYFYVMVQPNLAAGIIESQTYVNWLTWIQKELDNYMNQVKESGQFLGGSMAGPINMNGQALSGLNVPTADDQAANMGFVNQQVKKAAPRNLLDNSDFTNPVNQRGFVSGSRVPANAYFLDRWYNTYATDAYPMFGSSGLSNLVDSIYQKVDLSAYVGKPVTIVLYSDIDIPNHCASGIVTNNAVYNGICFASDWACSVCNAKIGQWYVGVQAACKYVALYPGEFTLDTAPSYQPKGYAAELAACQRYFYQVLAWNILGFGRIDWDGTTISVGVPLGTQMRVIPSVEENITVTITGESLQHNIENIKPEVEMNGNMIKLVYKNVFSDATHANKAVIVYTYDKGMQFSADL